MCVQLISIAQPNLGHVANGSSEGSKAATLFLSLNSVAVIQLALMPCQSLQQVIQLYKEKHSI